jgi:hypothetical protein
MGPVQFAELLGIALVEWLLVSLVFLAWDALRGGER